MASGAADYRSLDHAQRLEALVEIQQRRAELDAAEQRLLAVIDADPTPDPALRAVMLAKGYVAEEIACLLRVSAGTARLRVHVASTLADRLPATLGALETGQLTYWHCRVLVEAVRDLDDDLASLLEATVLPDASAQTVGQFRAAVRTALTRLDPADTAERHARAAKDRRVECFDSPDDGMATIWALLPAPDAAAVMTALDTAAGRIPATDDRTMDQRRADALTGWALDSLDRTNATAHGRKPAVQVTIALSTLLGLDQQPGELDGHGALPAELAREIAFDPTGTWRRLLTDAHGRLLEFGRTTYRAPTALTRHVIARDRTCTAPGCRRPASRCELDHLHPWSRGGTTEPDNLHPLCPRHHHLRHETGWQPRRCRDGTILWTSPTGHTYLRPPATYPIDHTRDRPTQPALVVA